jgi:hypothetical protein
MINGNRLVLKSLILLAVLGGCSRNESGFSQASIQGQIASSSGVTSSSARTSNPTPPPSVERDAAPRSGRCGDHHEVDVANYFAAKGLDVSIAVGVDCAVFVSTTNAPQDVLDWLKSRPYRIDHIDSTSPTALREDPAPTTGSCGGDHQLEVAEYFVAKGLNVSVGSMAADCSVEVVATNLPQEVLDWIKSRTFRIDHIDSPAPEPGTGTP